MKSETLLCPNCFQPIRGRTKCFSCGFDRFLKTNNMALDDNTILLQQYVVGRILGSGGFGITYKAYDMVNQRICAIKEFIPLGMVVRDHKNNEIILCDKENQEYFEHGKKRFMEEAEVLQSLDYNPIVTKIFDFFYENSTCYFVMEYIDGITLHRKIRKSGGKIPYPEMAELLLQVGECLDMVHEKSNIFHRDISPDNILVKENGEVRLIDFGNAKYITTMETQSLSIVLKHGFAPPEQYSGNSEQGAYTDVYGLASTFYYCATGVRVPSALSRLSKDQLKPIDFYLGSQYRELGDIFEKALRLQYQDRTKTVGEFIQQIRDFHKKKGMEIAAPGKLDGEKKDRSIKEKTKKKKVPYLYGVSGSVKGYLYKFPADMMITVGRSSECQIQIMKDATISRKHFDLFYDSRENLFYLENYSKNGTKIDQRNCEIGQYYWLQEGSYIMMSKNTCVFQVGVIDE